MHEQSQPLTLAPFPGGENGAVLEARMDMLRANLDRLMDVVESPRLAPGALSLGLGLHAEPFVSAVFFSDPNSGMEVKYKPNEGGICELTVDFGTAGTISLVDNKMGKVDLIQIRIPTPRQPGDILTVKADSSGERILWMAITEETSIQEYTNPRPILAPEIRGRVTAACESLERQAKKPFRVPTTSPVQTPHLR
jgi:hypothetical protein